jgi:hypothetical protein
MQIYRLHKLSKYKYDLQIYRSHKAALEKYDLHANLRLIILMRTGIFPICRLYRPLFIDPKKQLLKSFDGKWPEYQ